MKRFIVSCQIVIVAFFIIKILFLTEALQIESISPVISLDHFGQAIAQTTKPAANAAGHGCERCHGRPSEERTRPFCLPAKETKRIGYAGKQSEG